MMAQRNRFIDDVDLTEATSLTHLLDRHNAENEEVDDHIIKHSPFYSENQFSKLLSGKPGLCILDMNIQNIYYKFDEFQAFIDRVTISNPISAICLNE